MTTARMAGAQRTCGCAAVLAALVLCAPAQAATVPTVPTVSTGSAQQVSFGSATITGSVNPNASNSSYYFQYGLTKSYGGQTVIANAGAGKHALSVSAALTGLQPLTVYHFRLVAVNGAGAALGGDQSFLTTKVPLSLQIFTAPDPVLFGGNVVVQGTLAGTENANRPVILQADAFPFSAGFQSIGNPELTSSTGSFAFPILGLTLVTQFRVLTGTNPAVLSPVALENVAVQVDSHVARTRRARFVRIFGTVTPAEDGAQVGILRIVRGRGVLVGGTILRHLNATSSEFSRVVRVRRGVYRVLVRVTNGAQVSNYGRRLKIF
jgi:hypothetical protein